MGPAGLCQAELGQVKWAELVGQLVKVNRVERPRKNKGTFDRIVRTFTVVMESGILLKGN